MGERTIGEEVEIWVCCICTVRVEGGVGVCSLDEEVEGVCSLDEEVEGVCSLDEEVERTGGEHSLDEEVAKKSMDVREEVKGREELRPV